MEAMIVRYILAWLPMALIAMMNGALREGWYGKYIRQLRAHQISTLTGVVFFGLYVWTISRLWPLESGNQALGVGLIWLAMTVCFEFLFGHYVAGHSWSRLLRDYDIFAGRIWVLLLIWVTVAANIFYRLQR
jgi:hypothetical protein